MWWQKRQVAKDSPFRGSTSTRPWTVRSSLYLRLLTTPGANAQDYLLLAAAFIASIAAGVPFPLLGVIFGELINEFNSASCDVAETSNNSTQLQDSTRTKVLYIVYITIANWCFIYIHTTCWSMFGERLVRRIRERYLTSLLRQELAFYDQLSAGNVSSRLSNDLDEIQKGTSEKVGIVISSISYFMASYIVAFIKNPVLAGILTSSIPVYILMAFLGGHFTTKYTAIQNNKIAQATSIVEEALAKLHVVYAFGAASRLEKIFSQRLDAASIHGLDKAVVAGIQLGLMYFVAYATNALAYYQGSKSIAESTDSSIGSSVGAVYTVIFLLIDASFVLSRIAPFLQIFGTAVGASIKLNEAILRESQIDGTDKDHGKCIKDIDEGISFKNVRFHYPARETVPILKDLTLHIPANKHTAIIGHSGSGKSTIASLMIRLYDPVEGSISVDGVDLREFNVRNLRGCFGVVQQDATLLDRTILENIAHGLLNSDAPKSEIDLILDGDLARHARQLRRSQRPLSSWSNRASLRRFAGNSMQCASPALETLLAKVQRAIDIADADFINRLPDGIATKLSKAGRGLSGGQQQRIALARAMVRDPKILLLDEATSALDSQSERLIQQALDKASKGRTTISIAHRLSTIKDADNIIVMHDGEIIEQGNHAELMDLQGSYAGMVELQHVDSDHDSTLSTIDQNGDVSSKLSSSADLPDIDVHDSKATKAIEHVEDKATSLPKKTLTDERTMLRIISGIGKLTRHNWIYLLIAFSASIIVGSIYSGEAVIFGETISSFSTCQTPDSILSAGRRWGLLFFVLAIVAFLANLCMVTLFGFVSESALKKIKLLTFRTLFAQEAAWHGYAGRDTSKSLSYITSDASNLAGLTGPILGTLASSVVATLAGIILSMIIAWRIAIVLLACVPILILAGFFRLQCCAKFHAKHADAFAKATGYATEAVNSIRVISIFSLEQEAVNTYHIALQTPYAETRSMLLTSNAWLATSYSISNLVYALAYFWGSINIGSGYYSQTQFFIVLPAMLFSAQTCGQLFALAPDFSKSKVSACRILKLLDENKCGEDRYRSTDRIEDSDPGNDLEFGEKRCDESSTAGDVILSNIGFSYPSRSVPVLCGLDLEVKTKQRVAIVGPSGAGKSTIIAMIERFYKPNHGTVIAPCRNDIALVPQDSVLFEGTIRFNIALGARTDHEPSDEEIITACKAAHIHDTIMSLPDGYNTQCGPNGNSFSGGQRQRISIARALLRKPKLLLLDESTSALDSESERLVQEALANVDCTLIFIAHRLNTIKHVDKIFVIEDGKCTAQGTHSELLGNSETYRINAMHQTLDKQ